MWLASFPPRTIHSAPDLIDFASFDAVRRPGPALGAAQQPGRAAPAID